MFAEKCMKKLKDTLPNVTTQPNKKYDDYIKTINIFQYSRSLFNKIIPALIGRNVFVTSICDRFCHATCNIFGFLYLSMEYLKKATFQTSLAFQISVLERL